MKTSPRLLAVLLALPALPLAQLLYPGCATMVNGPRQELRVKSVPKGAWVFLNGKKIGATPVTVTVSRWGSHHLRIEMPGFQTYETTLEKRGDFNTASGNLFLGFAPIVIDAMTGAIFELGVPAASKRELLDNQWEEGDGGTMITVGLRPVGPSKKIGQMVRRGT